MPCELPTSTVDHRDRQCESLLYIVNLLINISTFNPSYMEDQAEHTDVSIPGLNVIQIYLYIP